jgi:hypothetical protein
MKPWYPVLRSTLALSCLFVANGASAQSTETCLELVAPQFTPLAVGDSASTFMFMWAKNPASVDVEIASATMQSPGGAFSIASSFPLSIAAHDSAKIQLKVRDPYRIFGIFKESLPGTITATVHAKDGSTMCDSVPPKTIAQPVLGQLAGQDILNFYLGTDNHSTVVLTRATFRNFALTLIDKGPSLTIDSIGFAVGRNFGIVNLSSDPPITLSDQQSLNVGLGFFAGADSGFVSDTLFTYFNDGKVGKYPLVGFAMPLKRVQPNGSVAKGAVSLMPNPAHSVATLVHPEYASATIVVLDVLGREVARQQAAAGSTELDLLRIPPGQYIVRIDGKLTDGAYSVQSQKLVYRGNGG